MRFVKKRLFDPIRRNVKLRGHIRKLKRQAAQARLTAAMELGEMCDPRAIPYLADSLSDKSADVREACVEALTRFEPAAVLPERGHGVHVRKGGRKETYLEEQQFHLPASSGSNYGAFGT